MVQKPAIVCLVVLAWLAPAPLHAQPESPSEHKPVGPDGSPDASPDGSPDGLPDGSPDTGREPGSESGYGSPGNLGGAIGGNSAGDSTDISSPGPASGSGAAGPADDEVSASWNDGTSPERQDRARELFEEANKLVEIASVAAAIRKYKEALSHWDHPKIRYNLAVVLMETGRQVEAYEHIVAALRHGEVPLGPAHHKRAVTDRRVLQAGLVSIAIRNQRGDVKVSLDGKSILDTSGQVSRLMSPGEHQLQARGGGFGTITTDYPFWPDRHYDITVDPASGVKRYWSEWIPWTVIGAGVAMSSAGGLFHWRAQSNFDAFDAMVIERCRDGCAPGEQPEELQSLENRAETQSALAAVMFVAGGVATVSGIALLIANRPRRVHRDAFRIREGPFDVTVTPTVSARGAAGGASANPGISVWATGSF